MSQRFVQRYNPRYAHDIVQMKDGSFVTFEAYEALDKQRDALLALVEKAHKEGYVDGYADGVATDGCIERTNKYGKKKGMFGLWM